MKTNHPKDDTKMKITIVQSEIEEAIRNFIRSQITVNEGLSIEIDLRATRGAEGYQADINISGSAALPESTRNEVAAVPQKGSPEKEAPAATTRKPTLATAAAPAATQVKTVAVDTADLNAAEDNVPTTEAPFADDSAEMAAVTAEDDRADVVVPAEAEASPINDTEQATGQVLKEGDAAPVAGRSSLFAGLQKVTNAPSTAD